MSKTADNKASPPFHLLIPAAGSALRMGLDTPKPYLKINDTPILRHTIEKFICFKELQSISVVINEEHLDLYHDAVQGLENIQYTIGSNSRKNSIYNGLNSFSNVENNEIIFIHDAARPMVQQTDIETLLQTMNNADSATLATPVSDTLIKSNKPLDREDIWAIQTPQAFKFSALMAAHEKFKDDNSFTDDAGLMRAAGHDVEIVSASRQNIKITTQDDLTMVSAIMNNNTETRMASGYDVHAFETAPSDRKLILGGIEIKHPLALAGHSDADVVLHAITDALLGTINAGDIGTHFPPSDPQWKDADSALFLKEVHNLLQKQGAKTTFIDVTIIAEEPKIAPHHDAMQSRIAEILNLPPTRISIKATTTEKLGFTGRKEGIACQALATAQLPVTNYPHD